jgi:Zn ribbon nucleic-acid-binding protein
MKTIVSIQEISEFDIKPQAELEHWRSLVKDEIAAHWANRSHWIKIDCPVCSENNSDAAFESYGIPYAECKSCGSLYAPLRPNETDLWAWYRESAPSVYWREKLLLDSEAARFEKIITPRAHWILDSIAEHKPQARKIVDVSHNGRGLIDLLAAGNQKIEEIIAAGMIADLEGVSTDRVTVQPTKTADLLEHGPGSVDVIVAIDAFDRCIDIAGLVRSFEDMLTSGGLIFATAAVASGFEIQTLWEKSPTVIPPDKLNLPTVAGLRKLFAKSSWEIIELSTPGMFDIEMVRRAIQAEPSADWPRIARTLVQGLDTAGRLSMIELLQSLSMTSFARIVIRKKSSKVY